MKHTDDQAGALPLQGVIAEPPALGQLVRERLREAVISGELRPGTRLRQVSLARALGVSRMPVRDAISTLVTESLLIEEAGGGVVVPVLGSADVDGLLAVREALETHALNWLLAGRGALANLPDKALPRVGTTPARQHSRFHQTLCDATQDRYLSTALASVWPTLERLVTAAPGFPSRLTEMDSDLAVLVQRGQDREAKMVLSEQMSLLRDWLLAAPEAGQLAGKVG